MRRILTALLLVAGALFVQGEAHAATEAEAIAQCLTNASNSSGYCYGPNNVDDGTPNTGTYWHCRGSTNPTYWGKLFPSFQGGAGNCSSGGGPIAFSSRCAGGVDYANSTCYPDPPDDTECLALNAEPGFLNVGPTTRNFESTCLANGCMFERVEAVQSVCAGAVCNHTGVYEFTGACGSTPPPEAPTQESQAAENVPAQNCIAGTSPQVCVKNDGEHCIAASTGKQLCWRPGETGTKFSGDTAQKRVAGASPPATPPPAPEGETLTQGGSATTATTINNTTITTTTTNYTTTGGTDAGPQDDGEPADGSGGEDEEGNGLGGSGECETGYTPSGDPVLGAILTESHAHRCQDAQADTDNRADAAVFGAEADALEGEGGTIWGDPGTGAGLNEGFFSFGGGACPIDDLTIAIPGTSIVIQPPPEFCDYGAMIATLFTLLAYVWALRIVVS